MHWILSDHHGYANNCRLLKNLKPTSVDKPRYFFEGLELLDEKSIAAQIH